MIKFHELVHIIPHLFVAGMKNVRAIPVNTNALHILTVNISGDMISLINDKAGLSRLLRLISKHGSIKPRSYYQIIVFHINLLFFFSEYLPIHPFHPTVTLCRKIMQRPLRGRILISLFSHWQHRCS